MKAFAKLNLALVAGPVRPDGRHEIATVMQEVDLHDDVELAAHDALVVEGFAEDTLVRGALQALADAAGVVPAWRARIEKRIPVAAGLGGGSSDAAAALVLANTLLPRPLEDAALRALAGKLGADVPFFLRGGAQLATADGTELRPLDLPAGYVAVVLLPADVAKSSTAAVYEEFDDRDGADGFTGRQAALLAALERVDRVADLALLPRNDLASSPLAERLEGLGAVRADVSGAGPAVYGLFEQSEDAVHAAAALSDEGRAWFARPVART